MRAVGLIIALMMRSSKSSPIFCTTKSLALGKWRSDGNPRKGLVMMQPLIRSSYLSSRSLMDTSPPMLWAYRKSGNSGCAWQSSVITSFCIIYTVVQARGPPEYPNPVKSIISTSNWCVAKKCAISWKRPECSPKPWMMAIVLVGRRGVKRVW